MANIYFLDTEPGRNEIAIIDINGNPISYKNIISPYIIYTWGCKTDRRCLKENNINIELKNYQKPFSLKVYGKKKQPKLNKAMRYCGMNPEDFDRHKAIVDAEILRRIYLTMEERK